MQHANKKEIQDLLDLLESEDDAVKTTEAITKVDLADFISFYGIKSGKNRVLLSGVYRLYRAWSQTPVSRRLFSSSIRSYLKDINGYVSINKDPMQFILPLAENAYGPKKSKYTNIRHTRLNQFIDEVKWEAGPNYYTVEELFHIFNKWGRKNNIAFVPLRDFTIFLSLRFTIKQLNGKTKYGISAQPPHLKKFHDKKENKKK